ncbi:MAG TPA: HNH endonuclease [Ferrovibrio sp.]|uniref:HNH endonuclease n=1 Tax=Ferrovibrio sp. TaxID=1917215 RepID=UPI002ED4CD39
MVKLYIGVTDYDWFRYLEARPNLSEVNFWQPGGRTNFRAIAPGELFLFKLRAPRSYIVGGGIFAHSSILPVSLAWEAFGESNGAPSLDVLRQRIGQHRRNTDDLKYDYQIGCRIIAEPFFFPESEWMPVPQSWAPNIVSGRTYEASDLEVRHLWNSIAERLEYRRAPSFSESRYGEPTLIRPRLGQGSFRIAVTDAYRRHCAVTGEKTLPILDAAHIRPYADGGPHDIRNGLLLRTDVHRLFDLGYVTVDNAYRFVVGKRLKEDFENGKHYYAMHGEQVNVPNNPLQHPDLGSLRWHQDKRFLG